MVIYQQNGNNSVLVVRVLKEIQDVMGRFNKQNNDSFRKHGCTRMKSFHSGIYSNMDLTIIPKIFSQLRQHFIRPRGIEIGTLGFLAGVYAVVASPNNHKLYFSWG